MAEFEDLQNSIDDLISEIRKKEDKIDLSPLNDITQTTKLYDQHLKDIKTNTDNLNKTLNSYLKDINTIETGDDIITNQPETDKINYGIEQQAFVDYNEELKSLVNKISDLSLTLSDLKSSINLDIDTETLDKIKETLNSNISINVDSEALQKEINDISSKMDDIRSISSDISFVELANNLSEIKQTMISLQDMNFDTINIENINTDKIDDVIDKINQVKSIIVDVDIKTNITELEATLNKIKEIDLSNIKNLDLSNFDKLYDLEKLNINIPFDDIESAISSINTLNLTKIDLDFNIDDITNKLNVVRNNIEIIKQESKFDIITEISPNIDLDKIKTDITNSLSNTDFNIKPQIDIKDQINKAKDQLQLSFSSDVNMTPLLIGSKDAILPESPQIENKDSSVNEIKEIIESNNLAIAELKNAIIQLSNSTNRDTIKTETSREIIKDGDAVAKIETSKTNLSSDELMKTVVTLLSNMVSKESQILVELKKLNFLKNNED